MKLTKLFAAAIIALAVAVPAQALTITPDSGVLNTSRWQGNQTGNAEILAIVYGITDDAKELYKQDVGGSESGDLAGSYNTTFANTPTDPAEATITFVSGNFVGPNAYLLVKDGNQIPAWYLFNLTAIGPWNGTETLELTGFWPKQGAISHVSLFGNSVCADANDCEPVTAPDGGSMAMLLGAALLGLGLVRRMAK